MLAPFIKSLFARPRRHAAELQRRAHAAFEQGRFADARDLTGQALECSPRDAQLVAQLGWCGMRLGEREEARRLALAALAIDEDELSAHMLLGEIELPGEYYLSLLERIHGLLEPHTYVEVGVAEGKSLRLVRPRTAAIGVDPAPKIDFALPANARLFRETSDEFFVRHDLRAELGGKPVELAFIDGMHLFEYALRDFINLERHCAPSAAILIHDCYPLDASTSARERRTQFWAGDVWRIVVALRKYRPDLSVHTLDSAPSGLGLVTGLDPASSVLADRYEEIVAELMAVDYAAIAHSKAQVLNLTPADWAGVSGMLRDARLKRQAAPATRSAARRPD